jgi:hypothetical protein
MNTFIPCEYLPLSFLQDARTHGYPIDPEGKDGVTLMFWPRNTGISPNHFCPSISHEIWTQTKQIQEECSFLLRLWPFIPVQRPERRFRPIEVLNVSWVGLSILSQISPLKAYSACFHWSQTWVSALDNFGG